MGGRQIRGRAAVLRHAASCIALVVGAAGCNGEAQVGAVRQSGQAGSTSLALRGAYTFAMQVDPDGTCGWPVTTLVWPVSIRVTSLAQGAMTGLIVFPPTASAPLNAWTISAGPAGTTLLPVQGSPGAAAAAYDLVVDGGSWEAGAPTRARDGRAEVTDGIASGARLILVLPGSDERRECRSEAKWSLVTRYVDPD